MKGPVLLLFTLAVAVAAGYLLYKIYGLLLHGFLKKMNWNLEEIKKYPRTPALKNCDHVIELCLLAVIIYKLLCT